MIYLVDEVATLVNEVQKPAGSYTMQNLTMKRRCN